MHIYNDCYPCFLRQALAAARFSSQDPAIHHVVIKNALQILQNLPEDATPPDICDQIHRSVRQAAQEPDPYKNLKAECTASALAQYSLLQNIRDEAHRVAISFQRKKRKITTSELDQLQGIGPVKKKALLKHFKSVKNLKNASIEEIKKVKELNEKDIATLLEFKKK